MSAHVFLNLSNDMKRDQIRGNSGVKYLLDCFINNTRNREKLQHQKTAASVY